MFAKQGAIRKPLFLFLKDLERKTSKRFQNLLEKLVNTDIPKIIFK